MAHTPGPWEVHDFLVDEGMAMGISAMGQPPVAFMGAENSEERSLANARLIAAAPDMLEALECLSNNAMNELCFCPVNLLMDGNVHAVSCNIARAAIAKAKGETV